MNNKRLSLLGLCRKADKLSMGHDSSVAAIATGRAKVCLLCEDASERLKKEFIRAVSYDGRNVPLVYFPHTMEEIKAATGHPAGVITINDEGFAKSFLQLSDKAGGNSVYDQ